MSMFGYSCSACKPSDPATSTVKVDFGNLAPAPGSEELEAARLAEEKEQEEQRRKDEEMARLQEEQRAAEVKAAQEAEARRLAQEAAKRQAEEEERRQLAAAQAASLREAEEAALAAAQEESLRLEQERLQEEERKARKEAVAAFLKANGFCSVNKAKSSMMGMSRTYPLHKAAEAGNEQIVGMLLAEGAEREQKNSSGKTAAQVAESKNKAGSHANVISLLKGATSVGTVGGA
eukprot:TRINITY_DN2393_c0_g2_i1.p1 TRINITY_DN2393_c0_g2~~TRINITY_DN2393_c0_g2_i1.p1  ORF type:complete len:264 (+),score=96.34 TRINITY_DN2393_c0_g2_i1:92-793(+)